MHETRSNLRFLSEEASFTNLQQSRSGKDWSSVSHFFGWYYLLLMGFSVVCSLWRLPGVGSIALSTLNASLSTCGLTRESIADNRFRRRLISRVRVLLRDEDLADWLVHLVDARVVLAPILSISSLCPRLLLTIALSVVRAVSVFRSSRVKRTPNKRNL